MSGSMCYNKLCAIVVTNDPNFVDVTLLDYQDSVVTYHMSSCNKKKKCNFPPNSIDTSDLNMIFINILGI
jgi:hypothetical protein